MADIGSKAISILPGVGSTYRGHLHEGLTQTAKSTAQPLGHAVRTVV